MATLTTQVITESGLEATYAAAASGGDTFSNDGSNRQFLHVKNGTGAVDVTITPVVSSTEKPGFGTLAKSTPVVTVPANEERMIGPFPLSAYGDPAITYDDESNVTVAVIKI